jgi:PBP1b-binding outer membrane lipoprotein LpoB
MLIIFLMGPVAVAPVSDTGKKQKYNAEPQKPAPTKIPVIPIGVIHCALL